MDVFAGLAAASNAINILKAVSQADKAMDQATLKAELATAISSAADAKIALTEARDALALKDQEIAELREAFATNATLVVGPDNYRYLPDNAGRPFGAPVCPTCQSNEQKIVQTLLKGGNRSVCPSCKSEFSPVTIFLSYEPNEDRTAQERSDRSMRDLGEALNAGSARNVWSRW